MNKLETNRQEIDYLSKHHWLKEGNLYYNEDRNAFGYGLYFVDDAVRLQNDVTKDLEKFIARY